MFFYNPKGKLVPHPERFGFERGEKVEIIFGTPGDDVFHFDTVSHSRIVVGLGGSDTFNAAASMVEYDIRYYGGWLDKAHWGVLGNGTPWQPWTDGGDIFHVGGGMDVKGGRGPDKVFTHGGHYKEPTQVWVQPDDRVYVPGSEKVVSWKIKPGTTERDGRDYTAEMHKVLIENNSGPITDEQLVQFFFQDQATYYDARGVNHYEETMIDFDRASGPTRAEVQDFVDHAEWLV